MKAIVIYSGGMDSFTLVRELAQRGNEITCLSFRYGQRHVKEVESARKVCIGRGIRHQIVDMGNLNGVGALLGNSALTGGLGGIPEGHYAQDNMKATVVPNRNMIMLSIATGFAVNIEAEAVYTAVHAGDHDVYPDCRPKFIQAMDAVTQIANYQPININAPYLHLDKAGILNSGRLNAGLAEGDYIDTWTCYVGGDLACGRCGACVERLEAFDNMGWTDPIKYEDREFWREALRG